MEQRSTNPFFVHGLLTALKAEWFSATRLRGAKVLIALPSLAVVLRLLVLKVTTANQAARGALLSAEQADTLSNGYGYWVDGMSTGLILLYLLMIGWAAYSFAFERDHGITRHLTIRRLSRSAIIVAKFVSANVLSLLAVLLLLLITTLLANLLWDFGAVVEDGYEIIGVADIQREIRQGLTLALLPLPACIALGLLFSVCAQSATQAVTLALGVSLLLDLFKGVIGGAAHFIYASFHPSLLDQSYLHDVARIVRGYSDVLIDERTYLFNLWLPLPQSLLFVMLALIIVRKRTL
jgi:ABC-type transport system involved in multi-copper enzyme maturation permease subunit